MPTRKLSYCGGAYKDVGQQDRVRGHHLTAEYDYGGGGGGGVLSPFERFNQWEGEGGGRAVHFRLIQPVGRGGVAMASATTPTLRTPMNM